MTKRFLLLTCTILLIGVTSAQELPSVVPPSPNAASLAQFVDVPVSYYTGVPSISVPVYTITSGKIQLPISLNYHASGIKVAQEASWVGLGWSLNAGGAITRQKRGQDDFEGNPNVLGYPREAALPDNLLNLGYGFYSFDDLNDYADEDDWYFNDVRSGAVDGEPDMFYYNFMGHSGKMLFKKNSSVPGGYQATTIDQNNLRFIYNPTTKEWTVTDGIGWVYYFKTPEVSINHSSSESAANLYSVETVSTTNTPNFADFISSWYIDKVITPEGDEVTFEYDNVYHRTISQVSYSDVTAYIISPAPGNINGSVPKGQYTASMQETDDVYLKRINFNNGHLLFNSANRDDIRTLNSAIPQRLDNIEVFDTNSKKIKRINLNQSYFNTQNIYTNVENTKRLRLDGVLESYWNPTTNSYKNNPPFSFEYNNTELPLKNSIYNDYWGYANDATGNTSTQPNSMVSTRYYIPFDVSPNLQPSSPGYLIYQEPDTWFETTSAASISNLENGSGVSLNGVNKKVDTAAIKSAVLNKISYPTGGTREFTYEPNEYYVDSLFPSQSTVYNPRYYQVTDYYGSTSQSRTDSFTLIGDTQVKLHFYVYNDNYSSNPNEYGLYDTMKAVLRKSDGNEVVRFKPSLSFSGYEQEFEAYLTVKLPAGDYVIETDNYVKDYLLMQLEVNYDEGTVATRNFGGGLRIASIIAKDENNEILRTDYSYNDSSGESTGKLLTPLRTYYVDGLFFAMSSTVVPMASSAQGSPIGYSAVKVSKIDKNGNPLGSTSYSYTNIEDWLHVNNITESSLPGVPTTNNLGNGQLLSESMYNANGNLVKRTNYQYELYNDPNVNYEDEYQILGLISTLNSYICPNLPVDGAPSTRIQYYFFNTEWNYLKYKNETIYDNNGQNPVTTNYGYAYGNPNHKNITYSGTTNSKGESIATSNYYPSDYPSGTDMNTNLLNDMIADNILNTVIKQETTLDGNKIAGTITNYTKETNGNSGDMYLPHTIKSLKKGTTNDYEEKLELVKYDDQGHILEAKRTNGTSIVYVWGYSQEYPIAKIDNATFTPGQPNTITNNQQTLINNAIAATVNETTDNTEINLIDKLQLLRVDFSKAMVTTYTYDPLIGVTSMTDPKGYTIYYEYDDFNRLKQVKDADGNLLSENKYNYKQ